MCTVIVGVDSHAAVPVVLAGVRDEFLERPWAPPGLHWPEYPGLVGGVDLRAGGTWLAAGPAVPRVAALLNGVGVPAPERIRRSRGDLPLRAMVAGELPDAHLVRYDPFHLLVADMSGVRLWSWDGSAVTEGKLSDGVHVIVNSRREQDAGTGTGTRGDLRTGDREARRLGTEGRRSGETPVDGAAADEGPAGGKAVDLRGDERAAYFRPRFAGAARPAALTGEEPAAFWGEWLGLASGARLATDDPRALVVRKDLGERGVWGTSSIALVALGGQGLRYDFCARPGDLASWRTVLRPGDLTPGITPPETDTPG